MSSVLFSPAAPLSRMWLLAVRKTSKPQSARYPARASGALVADGIKIGKGATVGSADSENIELVAKRVKGEE